MIAGSQAIAEVCFHMIAELSAICDPRSAIVCDHMETSLKKQALGHTYQFVTLVCFEFHLLFELFIMAHWA